MRRIYLDTLKRLWEIWDQWVGRGTPFGDLERLQESQINPQYILPVHYEVGWVRGVSQATGWAVTKPGPKDWTPPAGKRRKK